MGNLTDHQKAVRLALMYQFFRDAAERRWQQDLPPYRMPDRYWPKHVHGPESTHGSSLWLKLLRRCRDRGIDYEEYMLWTMHPATLVVAAPPSPEEVLSNRRFDECIADRRRRQRGIVITLDSNSGLFEQRFDYKMLIDGMSADEAAILTIGDEFEAFSSLYRYCMVAKLGELCNQWSNVLDAIANHHAANALLEYAVQRGDHQNSAWSYLLPPDIDIRATSAIDYFIGFDSKEHK